MADILDEVESDYHAEQLRAAARRYAWVGILGFGLILAGVGGWQWWRARTAHANAAAAATYIDLGTAADTLVSGDAAGRIDAARNLDAFARTAPDGYRTLARLRQAALLADAGRLSDAEGIWDRVASDPDADPKLRQMASFLWVQRSLDEADPAALRTRMVSLTEGDNPFRPLALEMQALLDVRLNQTDAARSLLRRLQTDPATPEGVRGRTGALLTRLGG